MHTRRSRTMLIEFKQKKMRPKVFHCQHSSEICSLLYLLIKCHCRNGLMTFPFIWIEKRDWSVVSSAWGDGEIKLTSPCTTVYRISQRSIIWLFQVITSWSDMASESQTLRSAAITPSPTGRTRHFVPVLSNNTSRYFRTVFLTAGLCIVREDTFSEEPWMSWWQFWRMNQDCWGQR